MYERLSRHFSTFHLPPICHPHLHDPSPVDIYLKKYIINAAHTPDGKNAGLKVVFLLIEMDHGCCLLLSEKKSLVEKRACARYRTKRIFCPCHLPPVAAVAAVIATPPWAVPASIAAIAPAAPTPLACVIIVSRNEECLAGGRSGLVNLVAAEVRGRNLQDEKEGQDDQEGKRLEHHCVRTISWDGGFLLYLSVCGCVWVCVL